MTRRILKDYGAVFVGQGLYSSPCYFRDDAVALDVQTRLGILSNIIGGVRIELQPPAMQALLKPLPKRKAKV